MAKDPAVLWYWNDWIGGTMTMSRALKGAYMDLLGAQHNNGHLSLDEIKTVLGSDFGSMWPTLQKKFETDDKGLFFNDRARQEKEKRQAFSNSRRNNLQKKQPHMGDHMENENENENENEIAIELIAHFNNLNGTNLRSDTKATVRHIQARIAEGFTVQELKEIIELKTAQWRGTEMERYLTPDTLFNSEKCGKYRNEVQAAKDKGLSLNQIKGKKNGINEGLAEGVAAIYRERAERERIDKMRAADIAKD